jgi:SAM-dependent methyltransferase
LNKGENEICFSGDVNRDLYAENKLTWAGVSKFPDEQFFLITKDIFDLESYLALHIKHHRQHIDGTGDSRNLAVFRDSLHHTRRYEYPYAMLNIPQDAKFVLDVGGGSSFSYYLAERIDNVIVLDIDQKVGDELELIKNHTRKFHNIRFKLGDARKIPYPDDTFDCTTCISVLEHMDNKNVLAAFAEMMRVTKPEGVIIITFDVQLTKSDTLDLDDVGKLCERLKIPMRELDAHTLFSSIGGNLYTVACIKFTKFKEVV